MDINSSFFSFTLNLIKQIKKMERELYNLKTKILRSKHISDQLREELASDVFKIEKLVNKTNDTHDVSQQLRQYNSVLNLMIQI